VRSNSFTCGKEVKRYFQFDVINISAFHIIIFNVRMNGHVNTCWYIGVARFITSHGSWAAQIKTYIKSKQQNTRRHKNTKIREKST